MWDGLFGNLSWRQGQVLMIGMATGAASGAVVGRRTRYVQRRYMGIGGMLGLAGAIAYLYVNR